MHEASLSISQVGCGQIVTMFITLNLMVYFDQILLMHLTLYYKKMMMVTGPAGCDQKLKMLIHVTL